MAQGRLGPRGENGAHPATFPCDQPVTDRIHARLHPVQATASQAGRDRAPAEADLHQLRPGYDSMLASGELRQRPVVIASPRKRILKRLVCGLGEHRPEGRAQAFAGGAPFAPIPLRAGGALRGGLGGRRLGLADRRPLQGIR